MALTDEQAKQIKEQIFKQLESFPEDKREEARNHIDSLNNEQLEEFIIKNNLIKKGGSGGEGNENSCIMCLISEKKINSLPVYEDKDYLAVLEINPVSEGHTIIIPKKHIEKIKEIPKTVEKVVENISKQLEKKLKAKEIKILSSDELGHAVINLIPIYEGKSMGKKIKAKEEDLRKIREKIGEIKEEKETKKEEKTEEIKLKPKEIIKLSRRIP